MDNQTWTNYYSNLVKEELKAEKQHCDRAPDGVRWLCSQSDRAKLLIVQYIIKYTLSLECYYPCIDDYLHTKKTCFEALALSINYTDLIIDALERAKCDIELVLNADYCKFNYFTN